MSSDKPDPTCLWEKDSDGIWITSCYKLFELNHDGPKENGMKFCAYCGKRLRQRRFRG